MFVRHVTCVALHARRVQFLVFGLHLCSRMRSFVFYYTMFVVFCQVFVTSFLCDLRHIVLCCLMCPKIFGAPRVFVRVRMHGFSCSRHLGSRVWGFYVWLGCLYGWGGFGALGGLLGVWGVSHWCGFDGRGGVCIMKSVRFKGKGSARCGAPGSA